MSASVPELESVWVSELESVWVSELASASAWVPELVPEPVTGKFHRRHRTPLP